MATHNGQTVGRTQLFYEGPNGDLVPVSATNPLPGTASTTTGMTPQDITATTPLDWDPDTATLTLTTRTLPDGGTNGQVLKIVDGAPAWGTDSNTTYTAMTPAEAATGTGTTPRTITPATLADAITGRLPRAGHVDPATATLTDLVNALITAGLMEPGA